jgi:hypothetical protein
MSDTKLLEAFDELTAVCRQFERHSGRLHESQTLAAFRLLRPIHVGQALFRGLSA